MFVLHFFLIHSCADCISWKIYKACLNNNNNKFISYQELLPHRKINLLLYIYQALQYHPNIQSEMFICLFIFFSFQHSYVLGVFYDSAINIFVMTKKIKAGL